MVYELELPSWLFVSCAFFMMKLIFLSLKFLKIDQLNKTARNVINAPFRSIKYLHVIEATEF